MTRARSKRTARRKIKRLIRKTLKIICAVWDFIARHPAMLATVTSSARFISFTPEVTLPSNAVSLTLIRIMIPSVVISIISSS